MMSPAIGRRPRFPLVVEHELAVGVLGDREVEVPTLATTGTLLVARGADHLIVPAPSARELEHVKAGLAQLPAERRGLVSVVDENAATLKRIRAYLAPLREQAQEWPEDAFVSFAEGFLYQLALASRHRAGIADDSVSVVRGFIPIIDHRVFSGEGRFRLAELVALICSYEPAAPEHLVWTTELARPGASRQVWEIFESAEFQAVVAASGRIGLVRHPKVALRRIGALLRAVIAHPAAKALLRMGATSADLAGVPKASKALEGFLATAGARPSSSEYWPPFISLGPAQVGVYQAALIESEPQATPPPGAIMVFRSTRGGKEGLSWLNEGEEHKLEREALEGLGPRLSKLREARAAQASFIGSPGVARSDRP
jgi:hypothetical protein